MHEKCIGLCECVSVYVLALEHWCCYTISMMPEAVIKHIRNVQETA